VYARLRDAAQLIDNTAADWVSNTIPKSRQAGTRKTVAQTPPQRGEREGSKLASVKAGSVPICAPADYEALSGY
jgi:hypothetical protein